mgnify:FL=1|tara:strand:- start:184 stop:663 length:480 start_codon:yes stop_codon:yes gene_type:complete
MKNLLLLILTTILLVSCNNKKVEKVESDSVTCQLLVVNETGQDMKANASFCIDKVNCDYVIKAGESLLMQSNTHDASGTVFTFYPLGPVGCDPVNGTAQQTYGYWSGAGHITSDFANNNSNPTPESHYTGQHWEFTLAYKNKGNVMTEEVTVTVGKCDM